MLPRGSLEHPGEVPPQEAEGDVYNEEGGEGRGEVGPDPHVLHPLHLLRHPPAVADHQHDGRDDAKDVAEEPGDDKRVVEVPVEDVPVVGVVGGDGDVHEEGPVGDHPPAAVEHLDGGDHPGDGAGGHEVLPGGPPAAHPATEPSHMGQPGP